MRAFTEPFGAAIQAITATTLRNLNPGTLISDFRIDVTIGSGIKRGNSRTVKAPQGQIVDGDLQEGRLAAARRRNERGPPEIGPPRGQLAALGGRRPPPPAPHHRTGGGRGGGRAATKTAKAATTNTTKKRRAASASSGTNKMAKKGGGGRHGAGAGAGAGHRRDGPGGGGSGVRSKAGGKGKGKAGTIASRTSSSSGTLGSYDFERMERRRARQEAAAAAAIARAAAAAAAAARADDDDEEDKDELLEPVDDVNSWRRKRAREIAAVEAELAKVKAKCPLGRPTSDVKDEKDALDERLKQLRRGFLLGEEDTSMKKVDQLTPAQRDASVIKNANVHEGATRLPRGRDTAAGGGAGALRGVSGEDALAAAAAWDTAAASAPVDLEIAGITGGVRFINGEFGHAPGARFPGGAPVYKRKGTSGGHQLWLYLAGPGASPRWCIGTTAEMKWRDVDAAVRSACCVGTAPVLPHVISPGMWEVMGEASSFPQRTPGEVETFSAAVGGAGAEGGAESAASRRSGGRCGGGGVCDGTVCD